MQLTRKEYPDWKKCPGCLRQVQFLYSFPNNPIDEEGQCASCFLDMIAEGKREVGPTICVANESKEVEA